MADKNLNHDFLKNRLGEHPVTFTNRRRQLLFGVVHLPRLIRDAPVLVMAHGFTDDKVCDNRIFVKFARQAREHGFVVLRFDFAGSGDSEGDFSDTSITGEIEELESAIEFAAGMPGLISSPIYLIGYSLGGAVALSAAARTVRVKGFVGWAPVSDPTAVLYPLLGEQAFVTAFRRRNVACVYGAKQFILKPEFFLDLKKHGLSEEIAKIAPRPVLLIQGGEDEKVLPNQTRKLYEAAGEPKTFQIIRNAPHSFAFHEEELFATTLQHVVAWVNDAREKAADERPFKDAT